MLYFLSQQMLDWAHGTAWEGRLSFLRLFRYITVRAAGAAITALLSSLWLGPKMIHWLKTLKFGQDYKDKAEEAGGLAARVLSKKGTPTMGGILIVSVLVFSTMLWTQWNAQVELTLLAVLVLSGLGFYDDYAKIVQQSGGGTPPRVKLFVQTALGLFVGIYLLNLPMTSELQFPGKKSAIIMHSNLVSDVMLPFCKYPYEVWPVVGVLIVLLAIVGSSNAVNLTDGLDGLAIGCTLITAFVFLIFTYVAGNIKIAAYLQIPFVNGAGELTVFCAALIGAGLGFLWFNQVFMGDTGSLALGGAFGLIAVLIHQPFVLVIAGGIFVLEASSVMIQTGWFKYTKKRFGAGQRIFLMAPLHHHFEKKGWYESQVVMRFYILCVLFAVVALATLKLR